MLVQDLLEIIRNGENSSVEFKEDGAHRDSIAKEMSALLNFEGGLILLGVADDGSTLGISRSRKDCEIWVMDIAHNNVDPAFIPHWSSVNIGGKTVGVIGLPVDAPEKPYKARRGQAWVTYIRRGSTSREATRFEEGRLYQDSQIVRFDIRPVIGTNVESLDRRLVKNYFNVVLKRDVPIVEDPIWWNRTLSNMDILTVVGDQQVTTAAGLLLFGKYPNRRLPQAGITATVFPGMEKDYDFGDAERIRGPLVSRVTEDGHASQYGVIDRAIQFVKRNVKHVGSLEGGRLRNVRELPDDAIRETVVNAVAHRDYSIAGTDIELSMYSDRLEVISPGRLPNGVTVEKMADGLRAARNELIKEVLRDYGYVEHLGMGVRNRIIGSMNAHNGTVPDLVESDQRFMVRLWKSVPG